jgi:hypothetical protein
MIQHSRLVITPVFDATVELVLQNTEGTVEANSPL